MSPGSGVGPLRCEICVCAPPAIAVSTGVREGPLPGGQVTAPPHACHTVAARVAPSGRDQLSLCSSRSAMMILVCPGSWTSSAGVRTRVLCADGSHKSRRYIDVMERCVCYHAPAGGQRVFTSCSSFACIRHECPHVCLIPSLLRPTLALEGRCGECQSAGRPVHPALLLDRTRGFDDMRVLVWDLSPWHAPRCQ